MSGEQEPWVFRGGLTADLQVILPKMRPFLKGHFENLVIILFRFGNLMLLFACKIIFAGILVSVVEAYSKKVGSV